MLGNQYADVFFCVVRDLCNKRQIYREGDKMVCMYSE